MTDFFDIVRRNFFTPIVFAIFTLAIILLLLGESRDAWFISVVITVNTVIGVIQEVRARQALKKLELMSAPRARRQVAGGAFEEVMYNELLVGDVIKLQTGDEVPADAELMETHGLEVDESMLTGEATAVEKDLQSPLFASTTVVAGSALARVTAVGADTKAGLMTAQLRKYQPEMTPLQARINIAITTFTYGALALAVIIGIAYSWMGEDLVQIFKAITASAAAFIPEGLLLASSLLLAYGSLRLAAAQVLPQKLAAIEAMALIDTLCVDKTGTLTSPEIHFDYFEAFSPSDDTAIVKKGIGITALETSGGNPTGDALIAGLPVEGAYDVKDVLAFSSERKLSGVRVDYDGQTHSFIMGAPEFVEKLAPLDEMQQRKITKLAAEGVRVLLVAEVENYDGRLKELPVGAARAVGFLALTNELRPGVVDTVRFLQHNGVKVRVISGDNPATVQYVAHQAGIKDTKKVITGAELAEYSGAEWDEIVLNTTIFARVLPEQKERLVATFRRHSHFTGMVGDGVNDALALKKADLGVAMYAGAAASRRVADIVLLNNSFTSLPMGLQLGNRIMQAIEVIAVLFFHKVIYGVVLLLGTLFIGMTYPFEPRHVTFMNMFLVTMPTLMWTLFPPSPAFRINPKHFWRDTLTAVSSIAILSGLAVLFTYWFLSNIHPNDTEGVSTTTVIVATMFGVYLVFLASRMLGLVYDRAAKIARVLYILAVAFVASISFGFGFTRDFFDFTRPAWTDSWPVLVAVMAVAILQWLIAGYEKRRIERR